MHFVSGFAKYKWNPQIVSGILILFVDSVYLYVTCSILLKIISFIY